MMTKEILYEAFCKAIAILVPQAENPVNGDVEESYRTGLQGILRGIYNRGIQDAVDKIKLQTDFEYDSFQIIGPRKDIVPDIDDEYYINIEDGNILLGDTEIKIKSDSYITINKSEILELKV